MSLTSEQYHAHQILDQGNNLFVTGPAGTGKTYSVMHYIDQNRSMKTIGITSTTGISALTLGGVTLHSYLGIGHGTGSVEQLLSKIKKKYYYRTRWLDVDILVIDELSMMPPDLFDKLEHIARELRYSERPFGGIQIIGMGDFCQLPPVKCESMCFEAKSWNKVFPKTIYLTKLLRQGNDLEFQQCLTDIRTGAISDKTKKLLNGRLGVQSNNPDGIVPTKLFATNAQVDTINYENICELANQGCKIYRYNRKTTKATKYKDSKFKFVVEKYEKNCTAPTTLALCIGAQVMLLINLDQENELVNGSRGIVTEFDNQGIPVVTFMNGTTRLIEPHTWDYKEIKDTKKEKNKEIPICSLRQIPLKLAYAITIHKSQSMSLDCAEMDLANVFESGMAYVALSRVRSLTGLYLSSIDYSKLTTSKKAIDYYNSLPTLQLPVKTWDKPKRPAKPKRPTQVKSELKAPIDYSDMPPLEKCNIVKKLSLSPIIDYYDIPTFDPESAHECRQFLYTHPWCLRKLNEWFSPTISKDYIDSLKDDSMARICAAGWLDQIKRRIGDDDA